MTKSNYFAIDSDILRSLAFIDILLTNDPNCDLRTANDPLVKKWSGYLKKLYLKIKSNEVHPVIVEAVYLESKHSKNLLDFMKKYCYFPNVNAINYPQKREKAKRLANAYCMPYKFEGEAKSPPMKKIFSAAIGEYVPSNDCFIMAQSTIEGVPLITANGKDFIFDETSQTENKTRLLGIISINTTEGYYEINNDKFVTARPIHIKSIGPMLKDQVVEFETMTPLNKFDLGKDVIEDSQTINI